MGDKKFYIFLSFFAILSFAILIFGINYDFSFDFVEILDSIFGNSQSTNALIIDYRFQRIAQAFLTGAGLSLSGVFIQALIRNPLADPYILGTSSGSAFFVNLLFIGWIGFETVSLVFLPFLGFLGSLFSLFTIFILSKNQGIWSQKNDILVIGVAVSSFFTAMTGLLIFKVSEINQLKSIVFWTFGSFNKSSTLSLVFSLGIIVLGTIWGILNNRKLDVLVLGVEKAKSLGLNFGRFHTSLLIMSSLLVGILIAFVGPIGFVGLIIPHVSRGFFGYNHLKTIPASIFIGGVYLAACDLLSRMLYPPAGIPIGIITAILGVPFFVYLIFGKRGMENS